MDTAIAEQGWRTCMMDDGLQPEKSRRDGPSYGGEAGSRGAQVQKLWRGGSICEL